MRQKGCPRKKVCCDDCAECEFGEAFAKLYRKIERLENELENMKIHAKFQQEYIKAYEELGTIQELEEAIYCLYG